MDSREAEQFFRLGIQYYVAARFSAFAWMNPVCGNLFHHAIEMFLKGHLAAKMNLPELKQLGHGLRGLWDRYKQDVSDAGLSRFDEMVTGLDEFESIRYPDRVLTEGMYSIISIKHRHSDQDAPQCRHEPRFQIVVKEIDDFVKTIFEKSLLNSQYFMAGLGSEAKAYLTKDNETPLGQFA